MCLLAPLKWPTPSPTGLSFGRKLPRLLRDAGLVEVRGDAFFPIILPACDLLEAATINQVRDGLIGHGLVTAEEIETHLASIASGRLDLVTSPMISAWGRRCADGYHHLCECL